MGWNYTPDGPFNFPNMPSSNREGPSIRDAFESFLFFTDLQDKMKKQEKEKEEKDRAKKAKKVEMPKFTFGETFGMVLLFSMPVVLTQLYLLKYVQSVLNASITGNP